MARPLRFLLLLVLALGLLTGGTALIVERTTRAWFEKDVSLRAKLALAGSRPSLLRHWRGGQPGVVRDQLVELSRDERILGAAAYDPQWRSVAVTPDYPAAIGPDLLRPHLPLPEATAGSGEASWESLLDLTGGCFHVSAYPLLDTEGFLGWVVLVHDLSFIERREAKTRQFLIIAFGVLAAAGALITLVAVRVSWRNWSREIRRLLADRDSAEAPSGRRAMFQPLLRDLRELMNRIASERELDAAGGVWTPQRLRETLIHQLRGERIIIVANREPYIHLKGDNGQVRVLQPASGLVSALEPVLRACSGVWVAHGSGSADRETADADGRIRVPPGESSYLLRRLWLSPEEEKGYYYGFSNEGLWPLCHIAHHRPTFRSEDWRHYRAVNQRFADAVAEESDSDDPVVLVQDYHFALLPQMIRERFPRATVLTFWHIPWPNPEVFGICPWREEILWGLLGSSILGFHTRFHCNNFLEAVDRFLEARVDREQIAVAHRLRLTLVRAYPISVEWPNPVFALTPPAAECRAALFRELGLPPDSRMGFGVDRLDYTKGIEERFLAVERLLERHPEWRGKFTFLQVAAPSRQLIPRYRELAESVQRLADRINRAYTTEGRRPILLIQEHYEHARIFRCYRAADLCYVSSLHDGMNLVAKEFVASRDDERGVLVLSHFTGAARELTEALIVNPYSIDEASEALHSALLMSPEEQAERMRAMRGLVAEFNVYRWGGRMLNDAARLRRRERMTGRFPSTAPRPATLRR